MFYCGERTAKGSKVTGGEIQSRNDDPRRKPRGIRLEGDALSFPQACLTQWHAMVRNGTQWQRRSVALQKSRSTLRGISSIANKMALGTKATASRRVRSERHCLHGARPDAMRDGTLMPSPFPPLGLMHQDAPKGGRATRPPFSLRQRINVGGSPMPSPLLTSPTQRPRINVGGSPTLL